MSERNTERPIFNPSGWLYSNPIIDKLEAEGEFPQLNSEEVESLICDGIVHNAVTLRHFTSLDIFRREQNNFRAAFGTKKASNIWIYYRRRPAFQRFELLYPEYVESLSDGLGAFQRRSDSYWEKLHNAYQLMAELVAVDDPYVIGENGEVDYDCLCR